MFKRIAAALILTLVPAVAAAETAPPLADAITAGDADAVRTALAAGAEIDAPLPGGLMTPLGLAVSRGDAAIVSELLAAGAAVDAPGPLGLAPLTIAAQSCRAGPEIASLLIAAGAEVDAPGPGGLTPLLAATQKQRRALVTTLLAAGADAAAVDIFGDGILNYAIYMRDPGQVQVALDAGAGTAQLDRLFLTRGYRAMVWPGPVVCPGES